MYGVHLFNYTLFCLLFSCFHVVYAAISISKSMQVHVFILQGMALHGHLLSVMVICPSCKGCHRQRLHCVHVICTYVHSINIHLTVFLQCTFICFLCVYCGLCRMSLCGGWFYWLCTLVVDYCSLCPFLLNTIGLLPVDHLVYYL